MSATSLMCTYLFGTFELIRAAVEGYTSIAKGLLSRIESVATAAITVVEYMMDHTIRLVVDLVKQYEKELFDMLYNALFGSDKSFWCHKLWKCLALLNELLDKDSWLMRKIRSWWKSQCMDGDDGFGDLLDNMNMVISDFSKFQQIVCSAGFTVEFGISYIKEFLGWCKDQIMTYENWIGRKVRSLRKLCEKYLDTLIDMGVIEYLEKLCNFFMCAFDDSASCSEIATASNYFNHAMSVMKLQKSGDSYSISTEYKNSIYGGLEGAQVEISNLKTEIDSTYKLCVDPQKLKKANNAFNLSKNVFPGGLDGDDLKWSNLKNGSWKKIPVIRKFSTTKDNIISAWNTMFPGKELDFTALEDGMFTGPDGKLYVKDGCQYVPFDLPKLPPDEQIDTTVLSTDSGDNTMIWNGDMFVTVTDAAVQIATDPSSDFAVDCRNLSSFINNWKTDADGVLRYNKQVLS